MGKSHGSGRVLERIHSCLSYLPRKVRTKLYYSMEIKKQALETKDWVQILDLLLSEDVFLSKLFL